MADVDTDVLIAGGGPTGLLLANELGLAGVRSIVVERDPTRSRQTRALNLQPRSAEILDWRGWLTPMDPYVYGRLPMGHFAGIPLDYSVLDSRFAYQIAIVQADVERVLEAVLAERGQAPRRGQELIRIETGLAPDDDRVTAVVATADGEQRLTARYLVAADGGRSTVRKLTGVAFPGRDGRRPGVVCDITLSRKPDGVAQRWALPEFDPDRKDFAFLLPLRDGVYRFAFGGPAQLDIDRDAEITDTEIQQILTDNYGPDIELGEVRSGSRFTDAARQAAEYRIGRVFLAGDAAHVHSPLGGQGMSLGLQDAFNLGWKLAARINGWAPSGLLDTYHAERHPVAAAVLANTRAQGLLIGQDPDAPALRTTVIGLLTLPAANRQVAEEMSGLSIRYDLGSGLGHRIPDLDLGDGTRLSDHARSGLGLLLDTTSDCRFAALATGWPGRIRHLTGDPGLLGPSDPALLVRPDGYVCGRAADPAPMAAAITRWFGSAG